MKLRVPKHPDGLRVTIEVVGPDVLKQIKVSPEIEEIDYDFGVDDRDLTVKAWFVSNAGEPVGEEIVLKEAGNDHRKLSDIIAIRDIPELELDDIPEVQTVRFAEEGELVDVDTGLEPAVELEPPVELEPAVELEPPVELEPAVEGESHCGPGILLEDDDEDNDALEAPVEDSDEEAEADDEE
jgi:hypothetical protein